jgi:hypothetical protein
MEACLVLGKRKVNVLGDDGLMNLRQSGREKGSALDYITVSTPSSAKAGSHEGDQGVWPWCFD